MRFAIVSDIHANMPAWKAVLTDIASNRVDRILCLGDAVGYGPQPLEVLSSLHQHVDAFCMGNHDAAACGKLDPSRFNPLAAEVVAWTQKKLNRRALDFLAGFPLMLTGEGFRCAHAEFADPSAFNYILEPGDALASWAAVPEPLLFVGHSHAPALHIIGASHTPHLVEPQDFTLEPGKRYIVNTGSVGHPRDGDLRACYVIHDTETASVHFRRIPFDTDLYRAAVHAAGLPLDESVFSRDPLAGLARVRPDTLALNPGARASGVTPAQEISRHKLATRRWRAAAIAATCAALLAVGVAVLLPRLASKNAAVSNPPSASVIQIPARPLPPFQPVRNAPNLLPDIPRFADGSLAGWRCSLDPALQRLHTQNAFPDPVIHLASSTNTFFRVESPPVEIPQGIQKAVFNGRIQPGENFSGVVRFIIEELGEPDARGAYPVQKSETKIPNPAKSRADTSLSAQFTTRDKFRKNTRYLRVTVEGETTGAFSVTTLTLAPPDPPKAK